MDRRRVLVVTAFTLAVLLVGATVGMLITLVTVGTINTPGADSIDVGFSQDMQVHHLQAITMATIERDSTSDEDIKTLAFNIETSQRGQVGEMSGWLIAWGQQPLPPPGQAYMRWMGAAGHDHGASGVPSGGVATMPGMATTADIAKLRTLQGKDRDVFFLQLMLRHHQGGLPMAQYAAAHAELDYVRNFAQKVVDGQNNEVGLMTEMLSARGASPLPAS